LSVLANTSVANAQNREMGLDDTITHELLRLRIIDLTEQFRVTLKTAYFINAELFDGFYDNLYGE
jgi:hypothetical protein